ncbi:hypothetical protein, partial [Serratia marcescens]|uniref:hypothetical protein n=1 Tax=Serratia marcescens TaxID=615 RepID=UPI0021BAE447
RDCVNFGSALLCEYLPGWQQGVVVWWDSFYACFSIKRTYWPILAFIDRCWQNRPKSLSDEWTVD